MAERKTVLIVDDSKINRQILCKILLDDYDILQAENGKKALSLLKQENERISVVLLDIAMPVMNGYEFLNAVQSIPKLSGIPIIVTTQYEGEENEIAALSLGASDFLTKPYRPTIIKQRIANIIRFRETASIINAVERDSLTGLYNKDAFYRRASEILAGNFQKHFYIISIDVERFKLVNDLFGVDEGDKLLKHIAKFIKVNVFNDGLCARASGDIFFVLISLPHLVEFESKHFDFMTNAIKEYPLNINLCLKYGIYHVVDRNIPINVMCDRAKLAGDSVKGKYDVVFACYEESLRDVLLSEQQMISDMKAALCDRQFVVYFQPIYDLNTESVAGGEALVRWVHPKKGLMSPRQFIPLFEKNGFITDLDIYVWDSTCKFIRDWIDSGYTAIPIAVNVSRVDIYNPNMPDILMGIINKYNLTPQHINLEITETAYTESPKQIIKAINELHNLGFTIEMDDFGSGYSSLNMLNELPLDTLKLDMRFLQNHSQDNRKGNILNFIVSLAKWLGLAVIAEGVESNEQAMFLRSLGCNYGQGYYFAKPLPQEEFINFLILEEKKGKKQVSAFVDVVKMEEIWNPLSPFNAIFNSYIGALAIYECVGESIEFIRGNEYFFNVLGGNREKYYKNACKIIDYIYLDDKQRFIEQLNSIKSDYKDIENTSRWYTSENHVATRWLHVKLKILHSTGDRVVLLGAIEDITHRKQIEDELLSRQSELRSQREFFEKIYDYASCGIAQFETTGNFACVHANAPMVKMCGFKNSKDFFSEPRCFLDYVSKKWRGNIKLELTRLLQLGNDNATDMEYELITGQNQQILVHNCARIIKIGDERFIQCVITNIAAQNQNETVNI